MAASEPSRSAAAICWRSASRSSSSDCPLWPTAASEISQRAASASAARKKKRSNTSSKVWRSSGDLASVAASASLKSSWTVQLISVSAAKASSSSEVPTAIPSSRSSSAKARSWPSNPPGPRSGILA